MNAGSAYLFVGEYGDPVGGPTIRRISLADANGAGTNWAAVYGPDATIRHVHSVAEDPYHVGHVWATCGDGTSKTIMRSTDHGSTWNVAVSHSAWQGVQISFSPSWVLVAGDSQVASVIAIDRDTLTPRSASKNHHKHIAIPGATASTDAYYNNAYFGAVDPSTGIYYCVPNDASVSGNTTGMLYLSHVGGRLEILDRSQAYMNFEVFIVPGYVIAGQWRRSLLSFAV
jgi:hypothetical protein